MIRPYSWLELRVGLLSAVDDDRENDGCQSSGNYANEDGCVHDLVSFPENIQNREMNF
jgi:hypothetical protein